jgi:hypothetical protein
MYFSSSSSTVPPDAVTFSVGTIYILDTRTTGSQSSDRLDLALPDTGYIDDWPLTGDPPPPWLPPNARLHKPSRWLPPRCHLPALVPRRDFPRLAPAA